ncbi:MAG: phosphate signaling complex protein PhoU [Chloroflexota bacterium]
MKPRSALDNDLLKLNDNLTKLASLTEEALAVATASLEKFDIISARRVVVGDEEINHLRSMIEKDCLRVLARQMPQATDLRQVLAIYSIAGELERIGDHASGISRLVLRIAEEGKEPAETLYQLPKMSRRAQKMVHEGIAAYLNQDVALAKKVIARDNKLDRQYGKFSRIMFDSMNQTDINEEITVPTYLLWMAHNIERIGDRVTNICERVIFFVTGEHFEGD